jgi:hypothetical protein
VPAISDLDQSLIERCLGHDGGRSSVRRIGTADDRARRFDLARRAIVNDHFVEPRSSLEIPLDLLWIGRGLGGSRWRRSGAPLFQAEESGCRADC